MKKKIVSTMLVLVMMLALLPATMVFASSPSISINKTNYTTGEDIIVSYSGITAYMLEEGAWVGVGAPGTPAYNWMGFEYEYFPQSSGTLTLAAPSTSGSFEIRFFTAWRAVEENFLTSLSIPFTVSDGDHAPPVGETPSAPGSFTVTPGNGQAELSWTEPSDTGGNPILHYEVSRDGGATWVRASRSNGHTFTGLTNGTSYRFCVRAVTSAGAGEATSSVSATPNPPAGQLANKMSDWARVEVHKAYELGLIPSSLMSPNVDYTRPITRAEFAGVAVRVFENLTGTQALPATVNPFRDTSSADVLKAYNAGIMVGMSTNTFGPNTALNREQCATALTRVFKRSTIPGWSFDNDRDGLLQYSRPATFADDRDISSWARDSVYFMVANGILQGMGNNQFRPRNITSAHEAANYAIATREQALAIAVRMIENL